MKLEIYVASPTFAVHIILPVGCQKKYGFRLEIIKDSLWTTCFYNVFGKLMVWVNGMLKLTT